MTGGFTALVDELAAFSARQPHAAAAPAPRDRVRQRISAAPLRAIGQDLQKALADADRHAASMASMRVENPATQREAAGARISDTMAKADMAFAAGQISGLQLSILDRIAREALARQA